MKDRIMILSFGKFKNKNIEDVPVKYLTWLLKNITTFSDDEKNKIRDEILVRLVEGMHLDCELDLYDAYDYMD